MKKSLLKSSFIAIVITLSMASSLEAFAMGANRPTTPPAPTPPSAPSTMPPTKPTLDFGPPLDPEEYLNSSAQIGPRVDDSQRSSDLTKRRAITNTDQADKCFSNDLQHDYFADQISYYTSDALNDTPAMVGFIGSYYGTSSNDSNYFPVSLIRHPLCSSTSSTLLKTMKSHVPSQSVIDKLNRFSAEVNEQRLAVLNGDQSAKIGLLHTWNRFFSCLGYMESLSTADTSASNAVARMLAPAGYRKPAGVKFYDDPAQDQTSRYNIGLFQFTPNSGGNIQPCIRAWNSLHNNKPSCQLSRTASKGELVKVLGSSLQSFNAFCGVHKLIQTFAVQVNSTKASATHPSNLVNGKLKGAEERCVTPHFYRGYAYNHFGPFQNSTGSNLNKLFTCIESSR